ncbi:hypothetical protein AB0H49_34025 [Nocardia sp. NPDC050713]|uniref:hypothetical protein n=1 Tax=Nocardia sp. NPDC050713 TaxID=3154511 RepID=UPI0033E3E7ED
MNAETPSIPDLIEAITHYWHLSAIASEMERRGIPRGGADTAMLLHRIWDAQEAVPDKVHRHLLGTLTVPHVVDRLWMAASDTDLIQAWITYTGKDH